MRLLTEEWPLLQRVCLSKDRNLLNDVGLDWIDSFSDSGGWDRQARLTASLNGRAETFVETATAPLALRNEQRSNMAVLMKKQHNKTR